MEGLVKCAYETEKFLSDLADTLDRWCDESRFGGWSTHQCEANKHAANDCRRRAAQLRIAANATALAAGGEG